MRRIVYLPLHCRRLIITVLLFCLTTSCEAQVRYKDQLFESISIISNMAYGQEKTQGGRLEELIMDIYQPKGDQLSKRPLIILAHGGYFLFGDKNEFSEEAKTLAKAGYVVACINYRLIDVESSDTASMKAVIDAIHDMRAAVRYFYRDAKTGNKYGIDTNRIAIGGYSAGAVTSLHYAYANTISDVLNMGGDWLLNYVQGTGGLEGRSGNPGHSSNVKGVINFAGSIHSASLINKGEPFLISIHGTLDQTIPFLAGTTGTTTVVTEGSGLIHDKANRVGLTNLLIALEGEDHLIRFTCEDCLEKIMAFLAIEL